MLDNVRVAAVAVDTKPGELEQNLEKLALATVAAANDDAALILFPELSLTGFIPNHPQHDHQSWLREALLEARRLAVPIEGDAVHRLADVARRHKVLISAGLLEDAGNRLYNAQVLVGPEGLVGHWRKLHIPMFEMPFYNGGSHAPVVDTPLGRIGVNICFDALLPESTRLLAVQNVEIVLMPFAADPPPVTPEGWASWAGKAIESRAVENGVFVVACNYVGAVTCCGVTQSFPGGGMIVSPRGERIKDWEDPAGEPAMIIADLEASELARARSEPEYLFRFRRPELYGPLGDS
jgi:predicted amidohydrolase